MDPMGIELKLTDRELPASPAFIRFLGQTLAPGATAPQVWPDQVSEQLGQRDDEPADNVTRLAEQIMRTQQGRDRVVRAYALFFALLTGALEPLAEFHSRFRFITVTGIPRSGGSYLTAELYRSLLIDPYTVPNSIAHDSFPPAGPYRLAPGFNSWTTTVKSTAEFLTMVEIFFGERCPHGDRVIVPKKLTQSVYAPAFFQHIFGSHSEHIFTVRHPAAACISTYEKSGGLPLHGRFLVRSNIEAWCQRDLELAGCRPGQLREMDYFSVYLRYWEQYHLRLATNMVLAHPRCRVLPYGAETLRSLAEHYHAMHGSGLRAAPFRLADEAQRRHPTWVELARPAINRVATSWERMGLVFPRKQLQQVL
jgi:hypothetical protein